MEAVAAIASIGQLTQLSAQILAGGYGYLAKVARAPSEVSELLTEAAAINGLLGHLQQLSESSSAQDDPLKSLSKVGVFKECYELLSLVKRALEACEQIHGKDLKNVGRRLLWPFKERETKDALQRFARLRGLLSTAMMANSAQALRRIENIQEAINSQVNDLSNQVASHLDQEELRKLDVWLGPSFPANTYKKLENVLLVRQRGTGSWLLNSKFFRGWTISSGGLLWVKGLPGSGKTVLCSTVIENLLGTAKSSKIAVLFFFGDYRDEKKSATTGFVQCLTRQLLRQSPECQQKTRIIQKQKSKDFDCGPTNADCLTMMKSGILSLERTFIVVDALDEVSDKESISKMLKDILEMSVSSSEKGERTPAVNVLVASRADAIVDRILRPLRPYILTLEVGSRQDIEQFVEAEIEVRILSRKLKLRNTSLGQEIKEKILSRAGTFLQARLQLDSLSALMTDREIKVAIQNLPDGLEATYEKILATSIDRYPGRLQDIKTLLQWLVASEELMSISSLSEVIAVRPGDTSLDVDAVPTDPNDILEPIWQLLVIEHLHGDAEPRVRFLHFSIREYLCSQAIRQGRAKDLYINRTEAQEKLAETCLQYISFENMGILVPDIANQIFETSQDIDARLPPPQPFTPSLLRYAAAYWHRHFWKCSNLIDDLESFMKRIGPRLAWFLYPDQHASIYQLWEAVLKAYDFKIKYYKSTTSPLYFAIRFGLDDIVDVLLPKFPNINCHFSDKYTPLVCAVRYNHISLVRKLIDPRVGADVDFPTKARGLTALHMAAELANESMVEVLLNAGASIQVRSKSGTTPFYRAARGGSTEILQRLYGLGSEVDAKTWDNWTPLMEAVEHGHEKAVELLLRWGADPRNESLYGSTPLSLCDEFSELGDGRDGFRVMLTRALEASEERPVGAIPDQDEEEIP
ncbi:uncharacterized protein BDZ99DRAFT_492706 [Mytilinidion resinicola]|uniref:NACHT domain-containing protein n=1 Tax=Mytilinidion resinicola TaxID=574789 RepID=A0A6A6Z7N1_9PEZI|nr:uncharacterized protein BDZ99DRAFT_492706 [Mytilinidion resinicola]KAF2816739.1 hypothetical protein BDZ99DRAFT_492706 [Mytilinidion resinicola]